jgi:thiol-disulfide isomerase/thioredoxin
MTFKKILIFISIFFNLIIIIGITYILVFSSFSANVENENETIRLINYDSINKINNVQLIEISPIELENKIDMLSKNKSCMVIFWASWCKYCPELIKTIEKIKNEKEYNFNLIFVSMDKPNEKGKNSVLKKIASLNLKNEQYITNINDYMDISNSKVIYKYLKNKELFDKNPGFPHFQIIKNNSILDEDTGFDSVYGITNFLKYLKK